MLTLNPKYTYSHISILIFVIIDSVTRPFISIYSTRSAYAIQFAGTFEDFEWAQLWKSKAENKCKLFCYSYYRTRYQMCPFKIWRTNKPHLPALPHATGIGLHMMAQCTYSKLIWMALSTWIGANVQPPSPNNYRRFKRWYRTMLHKEPKTTKNYKHDYKK
jgi:hypothetical protein